MYDYTSLFFKYPLNTFHYEHSSVFTQGRTVNSAELYKQCNLIAFWKAQGSLLLPQIK